MAEHAWYNFKLDLMSCLICWLNEIWDAFINEDIVLPGRILMHAMFILFFEIVDQIYLPIAYSYDFS